MNEMTNTCPKVTELNNLSVSDEDKVRAAYALNMCMVSISQIIDYDDLNVLEQEYEGILNNLNLEMMPKDEALLSIIKQILDTITFFRLQEVDKELLDKEYQQKMKNAIWNAVPNFGLILAGGNPINLAASLACQVGIGYMNYRRTMVENELEYEKQRWKLQRSAMEQFNGLRRELFDTAWRLADTYQFPDAYRLTEKQIKQYNAILMDQDEIRKYERLSSIKDRFLAYPPFWYYYGNTANHIARNQSLSLSDMAREQYRKEAVDHFNQYWTSNKYALLREDQLACACALELVDLLDVERDRERILELTSKAVVFSGDALDILQLCVVAYLKIGENDKASDLLRILVNEKYNLVVNSQILSGIYVHKAISESDSQARSRYETLLSRVNPRYLVRLPKPDELIDENTLVDEFAEKQEELLKEKFVAVINYLFGEFNLKLGKLLPVVDADKEYPDSYFSEEGIHQRIKDLKETFASQKKRNEYLDRLSHCSFLNEYFRELNAFFDVILELNCIRDRQKLQEVVSERIMECSKQINTLQKKIEERKISFDDMDDLMYLVSLDMFSSFKIELINQIEITVLGMDDMAKYSISDSILRSFCSEHKVPEPDDLISFGIEVKPDQGHAPVYFGFDLLGENVFKLRAEQKRFRKIEVIINKYISDLNSISDNSKVYLHSDEEFNSYFEKSQLKEYKDILRKTIAVFDDKGLQNVDVLFTVDGVVPVIRNSLKTPISYLELAGEDQVKKIFEIAKANNPINNFGEGAKFFGLSLLSGWTVPLLGGAIAADTSAVNHVVTGIQPMIDEICSVLQEQIAEIKK